VDFFSPNFQGVQSTKRTIWLLSLKGLAFQNVEVLLKWKTFRVPLFLVRETFYGTGFILLGHKSHTQRFFFVFQRDERNIYRLASLCWKLEKKKKRFTTGDPKSGTILNNNKKLENVKCFSCFFFLIKKNKQIK
jgi:hypothetical protein